MSADEFTPTDTWVEDVTAIAEIIHDEIGAACPDDGAGNAGCFDAADRIVRHWLAQRDAAQRAEERERIAQAIESKAARIARTEPTP